MSDLLIYFIYGPTASSKHSMAYSLYKQDPSHSLLVSVDSRKTIKDLSIGTNKYRLYEMSIQNPILGIDIIRLDQHINIYKFFTKVTKSLQKQINTGNVRRIIFFGGSALYMHTFLAPLQTLQGSASNKLLRGFLNLIPRKILKKIAQKIDPERFSRLHKSDQQNPRRLIRIIENKLLPPSNYKHPLITWWQRTLTNNTVTLLIANPYIEKKIYYDRILKRIPKMLEKGLVLEIGEVVKQYNLEAKPYKKLPHNLYILGYKEVFEIIRTLYPKKTPTYQDFVNIHNRIITDETLKDAFVKKIFIGHKRYAKQQLVWAKKFLREMPYTKVLFVPS